MNPLSTIVRIALSLFGLTLAGSTTLFGQYADLKSNVHVLTSMADSLLAADDSLVYFSLFALRKKIAADSLSSLRQISRSAYDIQGPVPFKPSSSFRAYDGYLTYSMNYRSLIDTPYAEKNILQHNVSGQARFSAAGIPLQATFLIRRSNSAFFRDIGDVQVSLDQNGLRNVLRSRMQDQLKNMIASMEDSLTGDWIARQTDDILPFKKWLISPMQVQRIIEANEILKVDGLTYRPGNSADVNIRREDSLRRRAKKFLSLYNKVDSIHRKVAANMDSLKTIYAASKSKAQHAREILNGNLPDYEGYTGWKDKLSREGLPVADLPARYKLLLGIRNFSVGRTPLNYSELTAKNVSINGINVEYNSWYYAALSAGLIDFRFRDFAIGTAKQKQYLLLARAGVGTLSRNFLIFSAFRGRKQLFASGATASGITSIDISGYGAEARWKINEHCSLLGEVAESISPDFRSDDLSTHSGFNFSDPSNKAFSVKLSTYYPVTGSRLEGAYKYTGSNYQSFSSFQSNSAMKSWYMKADQSFFRNMVRLTASVRSNDLSNPFIIRNYSSNTIFKSLSASFRKRNWPSVSLGYMPMSQLTVVDELVTENRFQSLNANVYHHYKIGNTRTASTVIFNRFYNNRSDSGFIYYNASSVYFGQNIFLGSMVASLSVSDTRNSEYACQVFDESVQLPAGHSSVLTAGVKINNFNRVQVKVGGYMNASVRLWQNDMLFFSFERGFLPGFDNTMIKNDMGSIQFTKVFGATKPYSKTNIQ